MKFRLLFDFAEILTRWGVSENMAHIINITITVSVILVMAWLSYTIIKRTMLGIIHQLVRKSKTQWDDFLLERHFFSRLAYFAPGLVIHYMAGYALGGFPVWLNTIETLVYIFLLFIGIRTIDAFLNALHDMYQTLPVSKERPIKGYIQVVKIILYFIGAMLVLSVLMHKDLSYFFTGLGALAAVLMLVFKDTILGFVASIQLSANNMVRIGDWITMPSRGADGTVTEITLNTVKVQNFDKTISTIPPYSLITESFTNWRGMEESGARRIKRHIFIDMKTIRFCDEAMIETFKKIDLLKSYLEEKLKEIEEYNKENKVGASTLINGRHLTNIGVFRKYVEQYLKNQSRIHPDMTCIARQLQSTENGLPIEVLLFSKEIATVAYEDFQADIFDHLIAAVDQFGLGIFQNPSGNDFRGLFSK